MVRPTRRELLGEHDPELSSIEEIESFWLEPTREALVLRARRAMWTPDEPVDYCPRCGASSQAGESSRDGCASCAGERRAFERVVRLGEYAEPVADWVREVKFSAWRAQGVTLGRWLGWRIAQAIASARAAEGAASNERDAEGGGMGVPVRVMLVPVPTSRRRRWSRGIDHTLAIARGAARGLWELGVAAQVRSVLRRRHGPTQVGVPRSERQRNIANLIEPRAWTVPGVGAWGGIGGSTDARQPRPRVWVVVDDVMTTGATMRASCRALARGLRERGVEGEAIWAAVVAVTPERAMEDGQQDLSA